MSTLLTSPPKQFAGVHYNHCNYMYYIKLDEIIEIIQMSLCACINWMKSNCAHLLTEKYNWKEYYDFNMPWHSIPFHLVFILIAMLHQRRPIPIPSGIVNIYQFRKESYTKFIHIHKNRFGQQNVFNLYVI